MTASADLMFLDCGSVPVPPGADCFSVDCSAALVCTDVCLPPSISPYKDAIRRDYAWTFAFWRSRPMPPRAWMLDIGANLGPSLLGTARAGKRVLAFEPAPINLKYLNATLCLAEGFTELVEVVPAAVGAHTGTVKFVEHESRGDNSAMTSNTAGLHIAGAMREIEVPLWSIDDYVRDFPQWAAADCALVKIDVQGFEVRVMEGAQKFFTAAAASNKEFLVRAEIDSRLELSTLGVAGGAVSLMAQLGFEVVGNDGGDVLWKPKSQQASGEVVRTHF